MIIDDTTIKAPATPSPPLPRGRQHALMSREPIAPATTGGRHLSFSLSPIEGEVQEIKIDHGV